MLEKLGFNEKWIQWIRMCITPLSFSVLVNGILGDRFFPSRGIRHVDPLSPYIFILCAELLGREISAHSMGGEKLLGVKLGRTGIKITFLTFADDTMLFAKASDCSYHIIKSVLDKYCSMSGQLVNFHKSIFQCSENVSPQMEVGFQSILQMQNSFSLGNYLGCPIIDSCVTKNTFGKTIQSAQTQLTKWKANSLSQAGHAVLIQSNLSTKVNFQMQSFLIPTSIQSELDKTYRNFFWNKSPESGSGNLIG